MITNTFKPCTALLWLLALALLQGCAMTRQLSSVVEPALPDAVALVADVGTDAHATNVQHRYKVEAVRFYAVDESSYDSPWWAPWASDEIVLFFDAPQYRTFLGSRVYEEVDTHETRYFSANEACILPAEGSDAAHDTYLDSHNDDVWLCTGAGAPAPLGFTVAMWEVDGALAQFYASCFWHGIPLPCRFKATFPPSADFADDLVDRRNIVWTDEQLIAKLPQVNDTVEETVILDRCQHDTICGYGPLAPSGPSYTFTYRITRMRDVRYIPPLQQ